MEQPAAHGRSIDDWPQDVCENAVLDAVLGVIDTKYAVRSEATNQVAKRRFETLEGIKSGKILHVHFIDLVWFALEHSHRANNIEGARDCRGCNHTDSGIAGNAPSRQSPTTRVHLHPDNLGIGKPFAQCQEFFSGRTAE